MSVGAQFLLLSISRYLSCYELMRETIMNLDLIVGMDKQFLETPFYGVQQMTWHLQNEGHVVNYQRIRRLMRLICLMPVYMYQPSMKDRMAELEGEKQKLNAFFNHSPEPPALRLHPSLSALYRRKVRNLAADLQDVGLKMAATEALRGLVSEIRMVPDENASKGHHIELAGELGGILALGVLETTKPAHLARAGS